ncbi:IS21 family transposase [Glutamicibacter soli]|uniref:IS21 family transposase n=1 Tax=Glutamicibacter soli TaxID=453836 RepID=UPI003C768D7B
MNVEQWAEIRRLHRAEGVPIKEISRRLGIARNTVRSAVAATEPPKYQRAARGSIADDFEPEIRKLLREYPRMPATVIAERIGWTNSISTLKNRGALIRPEYTSVDPADRLVHEPGHAAQMDLWFPEPRIPVGYGQSMMLPVLVMTLSYSRVLDALMLPSRQGPDLTAGMWSLINKAGAVPKTLIWDRESAIGGKGQVTEIAAAFAGTLATRIILAPPREPEFKGQTERNNQFFETSFLPGRKCTSPQDFNQQLSGWLPKANTRTVRSIQGRPLDRLPTDLAAMTALPPLPPATGFTHRVRLSRDYYVRLDRNDYSVNPSMIGSLVDFTLTMDRVIGVCDQQVVADHPRCWAKHQVITDPDHVQVAATLRSAFNKIRRTTTSHVNEPVVESRELSDYDKIFGLDGQDFLGDPQ